MQAGGKREGTMRGTGVQVDHACRTSLRGRRLGPCRVMLVAGFVMFAAPMARAQDDPPPLPVDPTPLVRLVTAQEKAEIAEASKPKKAIAVYLKIADSHVDAALVAVKGNDSRRAERELDIFQKAMAECVKTVANLSDGRRGEAKKIEQALYKQLRSLETVEELFPVERVQFADAAILRAKQYRVQMLNIAIASGDVLKDPDTPKPPAKDDHSHSPTANRPPTTESRYGSNSLTHVGWHRSLDQGPRPFLALHLPAQIPGDYLTEEEDDHVREAQSPDDRIKVFMRIADRRLAALNPSATPADPKALKKLEQEKREWGELPKLDRTALLRHYARAIEECMAKLEDAYERNPKSSALSKALGILREATDRQLQTLRVLAKDLTDANETEALRRAIEQAEVANEGARKGPKAKGI